ncbi:MAG: PhoH family protein [Desulfurococcales archaeon]|nr:PhoH family protein [Desulfurococcales archaeon]
MSILKQVTSKTNGQKRLLKVLTNGKGKIVGIFGPSGTGKSMISLLYAIDSILNDSYKRVVISKPLIDVETSNEIPLLENHEVWKESVKAYLRDLVYRFVNTEILDELESKGKVLYVHPHLLRGRSFDDSLIIMDDVQNVPSDVVLEIVLRLGENSRLIIIGDPILQAVPNNTAAIARSLLLGELGGTEVVDLGIKDIVRPGAKLGIKLLFEARMRRRDLSKTEKQALNAASRIAPDASIITVVDLKSLKNKWNISSEHAPDMVVIVKEGHLPRLIGTGGERISKLEDELGARIRGLELTLDFTEFIRAIHPVGWVHKHVRKADLVGSDIVFIVGKEGIGAFIGQKGFHVRFLEDALRRLIGVGIRVEEPVPAKKRK